MAAELPRCAVCRVAVKPAENVVFRTDGRVQHVTCPEVVCPVCSGPIRPGDPIRRDAEALLHGNCWMRRIRSLGRQDAGAQERPRPVTSVSGNIITVHQPGVADTGSTIIVRLDSGELPDYIPAKMDGGFGGGHSCNGCGERITAAQVEYDVELPAPAGGGRLIRLHVGCFGIWQAEVLKRQAERRSRPPFDQAMPSS
jgi:hypothetical protein